jgi:hypothetical protein
MLRSATSSFLRIASRPSASMPFHRSKSTGQFGVLSGAPKDELERKVFIYRPAKSAGQHASAAVPSYPWKLSFEKKDRWVNPLMGWTSSSDSLAGQTPGNMNFESKDAAIAFAEKNGEFNSFNYTARLFGRIFFSYQFCRVENNFGGAKRQQSMFPLFLLLLLIPQCPAFLHMFMFATSRYTKSASRVMARTTSGRVIRTWRVLSS